MRDKNKEEGKKDSYMEATSKEKIQRYIGNQ